MNKQTLDYVASQSGYRSAKHYAARCNFVFKGLQLQGKNAIDVGCGRGAMALWLALSGAESVLGIEPEAEGSTTGSLTAFQDTIKYLGLQKNVKGRSVWLENIDGKANYDLAIMYNVINHLDEAATENIHTSQEARDKYIKHLSHLRYLLKDGGVFIVSDCSRHNFWNALGIPNPFAPTIEWHKHQAPKQWRYLLEQSGFKFLDLRWAHISEIGPVSANFLVQYFTFSRFVLRVMAV